MVSASHWKAYAALAGAFVLGALCATATYHVVAQRQYAEFFSGDREAFESRRVKALARELDLTGDQEARVRDVFRKHAEERKRVMRKTYETCGAPMNEHRERVDAEIRGLLRPEQRPRFDELRAEHKQRLLGASAVANSKTP